MQFFSGATGQAGRFSEGFCLRRLQVRRLIPCFLAIYEYRSFDTSDNQQMEAELKVSPLYRSRSAKSHEIEASFTFARGIEKDVDTPSRRKAKIPTRRQRDHMASAG